MDSLSMLPDEECRFTKRQWQESLSHHNYVHVESFLIRTKYTHHSFPCEKGCLREIRIVDNKTYAICTLEPQECDPIIVSDNDIRLYAFDIHKFSDHLLNELRELPLRKFITLVCNETSTYHFAEYDETDEFSKKLYVYLSLLPNKLDFTNLAQLFLQHKYFVVLTIGKAPSSLTNSHNSFPNRLVAIDSLFTVDSNEALICKLNKLFSDILSTPIVPFLSDQVNKDCEMGRNKRLEQQRLGQLGAKDIKRSKRLREQEIEKVALPLLKEKPRCYFSASSLARMIKDKLSFDYTIGAIRKIIGDNQKIRAFLKPHHRNKR